MNQNRQIDPQLLAQLLAGPSDQQVRQQFMSAMQKAQPGGMSSNMPWGGLPAGVDANSLIQRGPFGGIPQGVNPNNMLSPMGGGVPPTDMPSLQDIQRYGMPYRPY